jgi:hypothetical protein
MLLWLHETKLIWGQNIKELNKNTETYSDFIGRLGEYIEKQVRDQMQKFLLCQLAFDNANEDCQVLLDQLRRLMILWTI